MQTHCEVCHGELVSGRCPFCEAGLSERLGLVKRGFDWYRFWRWAVAVGVFLVLVLQALLLYRVLKGG